MKRNGVQCDHKTLAIILCHIYYKQIIILKLIKIITA